MQSNFNFETDPIRQIESLMKVHKFNEKNDSTMLVLGIEEKSSISDYLCRNKTALKFLCDSFFLEGELMGLEIVEDYNLRSFYVL